MLSFCKNKARFREEIQEYLQIQSRSYLTQKILKPLLEKKLLKRTAPANQKMLNISPRRHVHFFSVHDVNMISIVLGTRAINL